VILMSAKGTDLSVCVVEKGAEVGAHILSGAQRGRAGNQGTIPSMESSFVINTMML
jgi:flavin-dependent dehydrogenase